MSIYRRKYWVTTKAGVREQRTAAKFTVEVRHPETGKIVRKLGPKDRKSAKKMEMDLLTELERGQAGLVDPYRQHRGSAFQKHIDDFIANLTAEHKDDMYVYTTRKRLERVALEAGWQSLFDASQSSYEKWRNATEKDGYHGKPTKPKTLNQFRATLNEFFSWCIDTGRIDKNPLAKVRKSKEIANDNFRRAATPEEISRFLLALPDDAARRFYIFLAYTALRRSSLEKMKWSDLSLDNYEPHVHVQGESNKVGRQQRFPLRADVAAMMKAARGDAAVGTLVFEVPTIDQHREYLAAAGIRFSDPDGSNRLDLHAFRKMLQTWMEDAGVSVQEASKALGHLHLSTTLKSYREKREGRAVAGVEKLPSLIVNARQDARRNGKEGHGKQRKGKERN